MRSLLCAFPLLLSAAAAPAATIYNGGFELPACGSAVCSVAPDGWTVTKGNVELVTPLLWQVIEGNNSVDLDGVSFGGISQGVTTVAGQGYRVTFLLAGNQSGGPTVKQLRVSAAGTIDDYTFDVSGTSLANMGWVTETFDFVATSTSTTLIFESMDTSGGAWGPVIDYVRIADLGSAVPEPQALVLTGAGLLLLALRRRR